MTALYDKRYLHRLATARRNAAPQPQPRRLRLRSWAGAIAIVGLVLIGLAAGLAI